MSVYWRNGVTLSRRISRFSWLSVILLFSVFFINWYAIYQYKLNQLKQITIRTSEQLLNRITDESIKTKEDINKLYSNIQPEIGYRPSQLNAYIDFFKHHSSVESIFFSAQANASTALLNPYLLTSSTSILKEDCDAALKSHAIQISALQYVATVSLIPEVCIYNATRQIIILMNIRKSIDDVLQNTLDNGYFVVRLSNQHTQYQEASFLHVQAFDYLGTSLMYEISPNQAYIDAQLDLSLFIALLITGAFLIVLLIADRLHRFKYEKINNSKMFELGYLRKLVFYDHLTGVPNRKYLLHRLHLALFRAKQYHSYFSLC